ncbi:MAG: class I SAM-dependent methyltransferase [Gammaproteobacteria bacterium]|nr:class I SAM-dependent methyltransferase [Gammaproteobacteria bacterium]
MSRTDAFGGHVTRYDAWFDSNAESYQAELNALRSLLHGSGSALEVGVGTGRFAAELGIGIGVDASAAMLAVASQRNLHVAQALAESLPFRDASFDCLLFVTSLCFVRSVEAALAEAVRVLRPGGALIIGMINADSQLGRQYQVRQHDSVFYRDARFMTVSGLENLLTRPGLKIDRWCQTLASNERGDTDFSASPGNRPGGFVVVRALKSAVI